LRDESIRDKPPAERNGLGLLVGRKRRIRTAGKEGNLMALLTNGGRPWLAMIYLSTLVLLGWAIVTAPLPILLDRFIPTTLLLPQDGPRLRPDRVFEFRWLALHQWLPTALVHRQRGLCFPCSRWRGVPSSGTPLYRTGPFRGRGFPVLPVSAVLRSRLSPWLRAPCGW